ncbi:MAG: hypothetical protein H0U10_17765 [Chloroflexia bacterium]|nr:hypothetical protein [Chloroflexia bacterium]
METVLIRLTLVVVAVIVVVLAVSLILVALSLVRANRNLARLVGGLEAIRDNAAPLGADLTTINGAAVALRDGLLGVDDNLRRIIRLVRT